MAFCVSEEKLKELDQQKMKSGQGRLESPPSSPWAQGRMTFPSPGAVSLGLNSCQLDVHRRQLRVFPDWSPKSPT